MSRLSIKLGFWSALLSAIAFIIFPVCFVAILMTSPLFHWTNISDYAVYVQENGHVFQNLAQLLMLLFGPLYILMLNSIHEYAPSDKQILTRISICFGIIFTVLICVHYFVQLSAVRLNIQKGHIEGLEQFVQANPASVMLAINMLGWTLFFGLSSFFIAPVFSGSRLERVIQITFLINGISCILGGIGYVFEIVPLVFLTINIGMGGAVTVLSISLCILFKRIGKINLKNEA